MTEIVKKRRFTGEMKAVTWRLPTDLIKAIDDIAERTGRQKVDVYLELLEWSVVEQLREMDREETATQKGRGGR